MVYRLPKQNELGESFTRADYDRVDFTNTTLKQKCPNCIGPAIHSNEKKIIKYEELELLKLPMVTEPSEPSDNITK